MTFCQIVLRIALRRRKTFPLIVHQSSDCLQMMKSSGSQPSSCVTWTYPTATGKRGDVVRQERHRRSPGWAPAMRTHTQRGMQRAKRGRQLCVLRNDIINVWLCWAIRAAFQHRKSRLIVTLFTIHYEKIAEDCWRQEPLTSYFPFICRSTFINDSPL